MKLDLDIGDIILTGRFKNKPVEVKEFGTDEKGQPTINGRPILKFRIKKLMPESKKMNKTRLKQIVKEEVSTVLNELNLNRRMMGLVNMQDKRNLADAIGGYVHEFVQDGFDERDIQKYMSELVKSYVSSNYRKMR